ncbi:hypothetical protein EVAR_103829_1 [Eumeta japonica]|uniref:Uncharacterized protein n=1 Tax=Eumeta variegata TaxID=151549 RepID=A0A4C1S8W2_EUMVA|nr:hypothetical protein EVAR_103829_1 [Eumeta japonica]
MQFFDIDSRPCRNERRYLAALNDYRQSIIEGQKSMRVTRFRWSTLPMDTPDSGAITSALPVLCVGIEHLTEETVD